MRRRTVWEAPWPCRLLLLLCTMTAFHAIATQATTAATTEAGMTTDDQGATSKSKETDISLKPVVKRSNSTSITVKWSAIPGGNYLVTWQGEGPIFNHTITADNSTSMDELIVNHTIGDLTPNSMYNVCVTEEDFDPNYNCINTSTQPGVPSTPTEFHVSQPSFISGRESRISNVTWQPPKHPNGQLRKYLLNYGTDGKTIEKCEISGDRCLVGKRTQCNCSLQLCRIELKPETKYTFTLYAENCEPKGLSKPAEKKLTTTAGTPFFVGKPLLKNEVENDKPDKTYHIIIDPSTFRHDNGRIRKYEIYVWKKCNKTADGKARSLPVFVNKNITDHKISFLIGENRPPCTTTSCNLELTPETKYCYFVRIHTSRKSKASGFMEFETEASPWTALVLAAITLVSVLVIGIVVVVVLVAYSRFFSAMKRSISIDLPLVVASPPDINVERRILEHDLSTYVPTLLSQNEMDLKQEFSLLKEACPSKPCRYANAPANTPKNRYVNILPFDETRVRMKEYRDLPFSDYINASYIHGYDKKRQFIACQGPSDHYIDDFWRMVWEKNVHVIAMVTQCVENNKKKCCKYWPDQGEPNKLRLRHSRLKVHSLYESMPHPAGYIIRKFKLSKQLGVTQALDYRSLQKDVLTSGLLERGPRGMKSRIILHFHYLSWPDMGCPQSTDTLIQFTLAVKNAIPKDSSHTVVHCSAGVGRTGTFIGLSNLIDEMDVKGSVDVFHAVYRMRLHRCNMVQTMDQYAFLYKCILHYYLKMTGQSEAKPIEEEENQRVRGDGPDVILSTTSPTDLYIRQHSSSPKRWNNGAQSSTYQNFEWTDEESIDDIEFEANEMNLIKYSNYT